MDLQEDDNAVTVRAEAPGFEPSEFDIQVRGDHLILSAAHKTDPDKAEAAYRNGVLTLTLPKTEQSKGRRIEVKG
jgi:HSP20 family protein